jgi:glycosyltransferase involved in cell wall biosynthesis
LIAAGNTSMREVVGDAVILVDPYNLDEIAAAMDAVISDSALAASLKKKGLARSRQFSWSRAAQDTLKVYEDLVSDT